MRIKAIATGIQIGASTHSQLQVITQRSLRVINTICNSHRNPIPQDEEDDEEVPISL